MILNTLSINYITRKLWEYPKENNAKNYRDCQESRHEECDDLDPTTERKYFHPERLTTQKVFAFFQLVEKKEEVVG